MGADVGCPVTEIANVCQVIAGRATHWLEPEEPRRLEDLFASAGSPSTEAGRLAVEAALRRFVARLATTVHQNFHLRFCATGACVFAAPDLDLRWASAGHWNASAGVAEWASQFRRDFRSAHDSMAHRARRALEASGGARVAIDQLAKEIGVGRRTLEREFRIQIGIGIAEYRTRLQLRQAVRWLQRGENCVESIALGVGWSTKKGLRDALQKYAGLTPRAVRQMTRHDAARVAAALLVLPLDARYPGIVVPCRPEKP